MRGIRVGVALDVGLPCWCCSDDIAVAVMIAVAVAVMIAVAVAVAVMILQ